SVKTQNTHRGVNGESRFRPASAVELDLSSGQCLALHVLEELSRSVFCFFW
ncbi:hypothetical protein JOQ06_009910, partial [Pogonophryne albipinna]